MVSRGRGGEASPTLKKVGGGAVAGQEAWWRVRFWFLRAAYGEDSGSGHPIPLPGGRPGAPVLPLSVTYQLLGEAQNSDGL